MEVRFKSSLLVIGMNDFQCPFEKYVNIWYFAVLIRVSWNLFDKIFTIPVEWKSVSKVG